MLDKWREKVADLSAATNSNGVVTYLVSVLAGAGHHPVLADLGAELVDVWRGGSEVAGVERYLIPVDVLLRRFADVLVTLSLLSGGLVAVVVPVTVRYDLGGGHEVRHGFRVEAELGLLGGLLHGRHAILQCARRDVVDVDHLRADALM